MTRVPPPGDIGSDQALTELRRRLTDPTDHDARRGRYYAAMVSGPGALESVLRLVDAELAEQHKAIELVEDLAGVWETTEPQCLMSRARAAAILREVLSL